MNLDEIKQVKSPCVYKLTLPNGRSYIGKTKNMSDRIKVYEMNESGSFDKKGELIEDIRRYGLPSINFEVLVKVDGMCRADEIACLSILEIKYIRELNTLSPVGYNKSLGGEALNIKPEHIITDSKELESIYSSDKSLLLYDTDGNFIEEFSSLAKCAYDKGISERELWDCVGKRRCIRGKYIAQYKKYGYIPQKIDTLGIRCEEKVKYNVVVKEKIVERNIFKPKEKVIKYDMNGDFCGEYDSNLEASRTFTNSDYTKYGRYLNGFILFKRGDGDYPLKIEDSTILKKKVLGEYYKPAGELTDKQLPDIPSNPSYEKKRIDGRNLSLKNDFPIEQYDLDENFIAEYDNMRDASRATGISSSGIWANVFGRTKKCKGYIFRKAD